MKKNILLVLVALITFFSCSKEKETDINNEYIAILDMVSNNILGLQFKGIEAKGASVIYEDYKKKKIEVVKKSFLGQDYLKERSELIDLRQKLNELTLDADMLSYVDDNTRENVYIKDFEDYFVQTFIFKWKEGLKIDLSKLRIIYEN